MSQFTTARTGTFPVSSMTAAAGLRVKMSAGVLALAGSTDIELGTLEFNVTSNQEEASVVLRTAQGTEKFVAGGAITAYNPAYAAANGKIASSGTVLVCIALETSSADNDVIEGLRSKEDSDAAGAGGTTAAAFLVDSDSAIPKIELASYVGGTGDYKVTLKPASTLTGNRVITLQDSATQVLVARDTTDTLTNKTLSTGTLDLRPATTLTPDAASGAPATMTAGITQYTVGAVTNDANDWVVLPAIAGVAIGHTITIACNAGTNFELRTPASSNTKINDVDSDGSQEYLCTDTDVVVVRKATTTGWIAQSFTKLGAVRTAVIPD